jgi:hypothetical protein
MTSCVCVRVPHTQRLVSEAWIDEITSWGPLDQQVRHGSAGPAGASELCDLSAVGCARAVHATFF